jgi:hypothetical protein
MDYQDYVGDNSLGVPFDYMMETDAKAGLLFEAATLEKIGDFAAMQTRAQGMSCALVWLDGQDYSYQALESLVSGIADLDGDGEISDEEDALFNDILNAAGGALITLGGLEENVKSFIDDEDDAAGKKLGNYVNGKMDGVSEDDDDLVSGYAVMEDAVLEASYRRVRVVKDGKLVFKKKRIGRGKRLSAKQRMALKKARRKANTGAARAARKKAMRLRKSRGL